MPSLRDFALASGDNIPRSISFPQEIGTDEAPNFVTFRPVEINFGKYKPGGTTKEAYGNAFNKSNLSTWNPAGDYTTEVANQVKSGIGGIFDNLANGAASILNSLGKGLVNFKGNVNLFGGVINAKIDIGSLGVGISGFQTANTIRKLPGINLYLPPELGLQVVSNYTQTELGAMGLAAVDLINKNVVFENEQDLSKQATEAMKSMFTGLVNDISRTGKLGAAVQRATGRVSNAYTYAIFNGMKHRNFSYNFRMVAKNEEESKIIKDICDNFMFFMLPSKSKDDFHHYTVPCMWEISYNRYGEKNTYFDQPNNCFLTSVDIKYNSSGQGMTYNNGAPIDVTLSLSFMEIEPLYNELERSNSSRAPK